MFVGENMVNEYLEKIKNQLLERRIDVHKQMTELSNTYKENVEFIKILEESNDPTFESFTPREVNGFNRRKISELEEQQKRLTVELEEIRNEITQIDNDIYEISSVMKVAKGNINSVSSQILDNSSNTDDYNDYDVKLALLEIQENERQRIARELHDSTVQNLTSLVHKTELCSKLIDVDLVRCKLELMSMGKILRDIIGDTRNMIYDLRPMSFDDIGFDVTVERFIDKVRSVSGKEVTLKVEGTTYPIQNVIGLTLLRVIQEACNNSIKHSLATSINVTLHYLEDYFIVEILDDGKGFVVDNTNVSREDNSGFGLSMMRERIFLLSGELIIDSEPGKGCCIKAEVPIEEEI